MINHYTDNKNTIKLDINFSFYISRIQAVIANTLGLKISMKAQSTILVSSVVKSMLVGTIDPMISST